VGNGEDLGGFDENILLRLSGVTNPAEKPSSVPA